MKTTNLHGVDPAIVRAILNDPYSHDGDISVSRLCKPPQMVALEWQHKDEIEEGG